MCIASIEMFQVDYLFNGGAPETHDLSCSSHPLLIGPMLTEHRPKKHVCANDKYFVRTVYHCKHDV